MAVSRGNLYVQILSWNNNMASCDSFKDFRNFKRLTTDETFQLLKIRPKKSHNLLRALDIFSRSCCHLTPLKYS